MTSIRCLKWIPFPKKRPTPLRDSASRATFPLGRQSMSKVRVLCIIQRSQDRTLRPAHVTARVLEASA